jgi:hypothetical protein
LIQGYITSLVRFIQSMRLRLVPAWLSESCLAPTRRGLGEDSETEWCVNAPASMYPLAQGGSNAYSTTGRLGATLDPLPLGGTR